MTRIKLSIGKKLACAGGPLVLRALCEENEGFNSHAPHPTSSAPFTPTMISVAIILKGELMILSKCPKLISKYTQILYLSNVVETSKFAYTVHLLYFL